MSLFQNTVLQKYLNRINAGLLEVKYREFVAYFGNPGIQENIRNSKEEQFQEGFLRELFVNILGYTLNPSADYNLTTEYKNVKDSKKADGAIVIDKVVKAVIELKGTEITDLSKVEAQAFGYKNNQPDCVYVITSNFEKLRFYIDNAIEFEEFNLFSLSLSDFGALYLCLSYDSILKGIPKAIKTESLSEEDVITKKLYQDYSLFKRELYQNLVQQNPQYDSLTLFKESQKLLDRFLFLFFAEDRQLLPPNSVRLVLQDWRDLQERDEHVPLYNRFKKYFGYMNTGFKGKRYDVYAYNGGLFRPDDILDSLSIDDEMLYRHTLTLSEYDFASEVDVNILGRIFENSLNEIDEIKARIEGKEVDKTKTRRKKEGIFYTPKYITKYIVENTVGKLCAEKKAELQINEEEYAVDRKHNIRTRQPLADKLKEYRNWLLEITICDPACGSGAFLNQALDFLINEHRYIDELQARLFGDTLVLSDIEKSILEKNLFGVDLNEESVEIAKLSLWLRTAQPNRKLNDLNNNIKCGNSLIDDPSVAGDKAFNWQNEFPEIFAKGGFDVVIGNPPYVNISTLSQKTHNYFEEKYSEIHTGYNDLMYYFLYQGIMLLNSKGLFGMIASNYFIGNEFAKALRRFLSKYITSLLNFGEYYVFEDANVHTVVVFADKIAKNSQIEYSHLLYSNFRLTSIEHGLFEVMKNNRADILDYWIFTSSKKLDLINKLISNCVFLGDIGEIDKGSTSGKNEIFTIPKEKAINYNIEKELLRKNVKNGDIQRYFINNRDTFLIYTDNKTVLDQYPNAFKYFDGFKEILSIRNEVIKGLYPWWRMERPRKKEIFDSNEKIVVPYRADVNRFAYDNEQRFNDGGDIRVIVITDPELSIKFILALLNSFLLNWYYGFIGKPKGKTREYFNEPLAKIPLRRADIKSQFAFIENADLMLSLNKDLQETSQKFQRSIQRKFSLSELSNKLRDWHLLTYAEFIKELDKKKVKMSLTEEAEWESYFIQEAQKANEIRARIETTDKEIDHMVYELYGLTEEEIKIVEGK